MRGGRPGGMGAHRSWWLEEALAAGEPDAPALQGDARADVCIVGGGYTGLWTALRLKDLCPSLDIVLVEADICGGGASGRNGGCAFSWWSKFLVLMGCFGPSDALDLAKASESAVEEIGRFCERHRVDAHYARKGWLWTATNETQVNAWRGTVEALDRLGHRPFQMLSREEAAGRAGSASHLGGVYLAGVATLQPAVLARGLRRAAIERGVRIHERTPMTRLVRGRGATVQCPDGRVTADKVVLAVNAWGTRFAALRRHVAVIASDMIATEPAPERLRAIGWDRGLEVSDSRLLINYYHATAAGRVVFGKGGGALAFGGRIGSRYDGESPRAEAVVQSFRGLYPTLSDVAVTHAWTGPIDRTSTGIPFFGYLGADPRVSFGIGFSGNGVAPSVLGGRILASLVLDGCDEWSRSPLVGPPHGRFPPEPVRYLGGRLVRYAVQRKEECEDRGVRPPVLTRYLARLAGTTTVATNV